MPSFLPIIPIIDSSIGSHALCSRLPIPALRFPLPASRFPLPDLLDLDLDVDAGGKIELGQRVDRCRARIKDVDQPLVRLQLELFSRLFVNVRRAKNCPSLRLGRQRNRTTHLSTRLLRRANDVRRGLIDDGVVERLEPNSNSSCHNFLSSLFCVT